jgi:hypothetical protein
MAFWELRPEMLGSLWLKGSGAGEGKRCSFRITSWHLPYTREKAQKTSIIVESGKGLLVAPTWLSFEGQPRLVSRASVHLSSY